MSNAEFYLRRGPFGFTIKTEGWTDQEDAEKAARYLAMFVRSQTRQETQELYGALLHERAAPGEAATPRHAALIHEVRDREGKAFLEAVSDWLFRPKEGHAIRLCAAGDTSGSDA